jgi:hypothetical protein
MYRIPLCGRNPQAVEQSEPLNFGWSADLEIGDTAGLETCATGAAKNDLRTSGIPGGQSA